MKKKIYTDLTEGEYFDFLKELSIESYANHLLAIQDGSPMSICFADPLGFYILHKYKNHYVYLVNWRGFSSSLELQDALEIRLKRFVAEDEYYSNIYTSNS